jgi:lactate dehydrogenase-like 2-hydroxyacid dehydrogenase
MPFVDLVLSSPFLLLHATKGRETARLFKACGSTVVALNRTGKPAPEKGYILPGCGDPDGSIPSEWYSTQSHSSTLEFFSTCDVVVNTLPSSDATRGFVGREELRAMKGDAIYVNIGRGDTTDQEALIEALQARAGEGEEKGASGTLRIGAAALECVLPFLSLLRCC